MQKHYFGGHGSKQFLGRKFRLLVVEEPFVMKNVSFQFALGLVPFLFFADKSVLLFNTLVPVAGPVVLVKLNPVLHADPAKLVLTGLTLHVVAAPVLFDWLSALGAAPSVGLQPECVFGLAGLLCLPDSGHIARAGRVLLLPTAQARFLSANALARLLHTVGAPDQT